jgi:hypothetical protein
MPAWHQPHVVEPNVIRSCADYSQRWAQYRDAMHVHSCQDITFSVNHILSHMFHARHHVMLDFRHYTPLGVN